MSQRTQVWAWLTIRGTAIFLAFAVLVHLVTIIIATRQGLSAEAILDRTRSNLPWLMFYILFAVSAGVHGALGLRVVVTEHTGWRGRSLDTATTIFAVAVSALGITAAGGLY